MFSKTQIVSYLIISFLSFFCLGMTSRPAAKTIISGYVRDSRSKQPVSGVKVQLPSLLSKEKSSTATNDIGYYELKDLNFSKLGSYYNLKFSKDGYMIERDQIFQERREIRKNKSLMSNKIPPPVPPPDNIPPVINSSLYLYAG